MKELICITFFIKPLLDSNLDGQGGNGTSNYLRNGTWVLLKGWFDSAFLLSEDLITGTRGPAVSGPWPEASVPLDAGLQLGFLEVDRQSAFPSERTEIKWKKPSAFLF